jgi:predicted DNA-binding WGR domain protein
MSETWEVSLQFVEGGSRKYWRGRVDGRTLVINFGRMGTEGQTKTKDYRNEGEARAELEKTAGSKRRKGYADGGDAEAAPAAAAPALSVVPEPELTTSTTLRFSAGGRTIEAHMKIDGGVLRTEVAERFVDDAAAAAALGRARKALVDDGWREG